MICKKCKSRMIFTECNNGVKLFQCINATCGNEVKEGLSEGEKTVLLNELKIKKDSLDRLLSFNLKSDEAKTEIKLLRKEIKIIEGSLN